MKHLVIGLGEVGKAMQEILECDGLDSLTYPSDKLLDEHYDMLHICFPFTPKFPDIVRDYQRRFKPIYTVIHSSVPIGTSANLGVTHSPVRGKHPYLAESIRKFTKYVAGVNCVQVSSELRLYGLITEVLEYSDNSEAGKLVDLMQYGLSILVEKEIHRFCEQRGLDFDVVYRRFNNSYNTGYTEMKHPEFVRPVLTHKEGKIGGHCVVPMMKWLPMDSAMKIIKDNGKL